MEERALQSTHYCQSIVRVKHAVLSMEDVVLNGLIDCPGKENKQVLACK